MLSSESGNFRKSYEPPIAGVSFTDSRPKGQNCSNECGFHFSFMNAENCCLSCFKLLCSGCWIKIFGPPKM